MHRRTILAAAIAAASLALPAAAGAHVTLQPGEAPAGAFVKLDVRVPNERDDASTTKVDVRLPDGFAFLSYESVPGWTVRVVREKLDTPIQGEGGEITEQVTRVTWTGQGSQGRIRAGQFRDFPISVQVPGKEGDTLTFRAVQTYSSGEVVRWIGAPDAETPAPQVAVIAAAGTDDAAPAAAAAPPAAAATDGDDGADGLTIAALIVGALALLAALAALATSRRRTA